MTGFAVEGHRFTGGEGKPVTLEDHGRDDGFRGRESAMNLTWRFSDADLADSMPPVRGRADGVDQGSAGAGAAANAPGSVNMPGAQRPGVARIARG